MPKWTEYTSKDTLADNDEVMLYDATARANKRGLMSKFWDYVVDKMATAVISKLETENKTIIGALNKLNSDTQFANNRLDVSKFPATTPPGNYPIGISLASNSASATAYGYPHSYATIITIKFIKSRSLQFCSSYKGELSVRMDATNDTWTSWKVIV